MKKSGTLSFKSDGPCPRAHPWKALKTRKYLFYLESMHLQWTEYFAKLFTGIKKGARPPKNFFFAARVEPLVDFWDKSTTLVAELKA